MPMPSLTVMTTRFWQVSNRSNHTLASTQALAAFSSSTSRPVALAMGLRGYRYRAIAGGGEYQTVLRVIEAPGKLMPAPSIFFPRGLHHALDGFDQGANGDIGVVGRLHHFLRNELAVSVGQRDGGLEGAHVHTDDDALIVEAEKVGRRPRGGRPVGPSTAQFSSINCSTISEMVLRCKPETRARSARETGWRLRIR